MSFEVPKPPSIDPEQKDLDAAAEKIEKGFEEDQSVEAAQEAAREARLQAESDEVQEELKDLGEGIEKMSELDEMAKVRGMQKEESNKQAVFKQEQIELNREGDTIEYLGEVKDLLKEIKAKKLYDKVEPFIDEKFDSISDPNEYAVYRFFTGGENPEKAPQQDLEGVENVRYYMQGLLYESMDAEERISQQRELDMRLSVAFENAPMEVVTEKDSLLADVQKRIAEKLGEGETKPDMNQWATFQILSGSTDYEAVKNFDLEGDLRLFPYILETIEKYENKDAGASARLAA